MEGVSQNIDQETLVENGNEIDSVPPTEERDMRYFENDTSELEERGEDQSPRTDPSILKEKVETVILAVEESSRQIISKWSEFLTEGEEFEDLCLQRLDQLICEAQTLEEAVIEQKHKLFERAQHLADMLGKYNR